MSDTIATYSFLPWLRQGISNQIVGGASDNGRAVMNVQLQLNGAGVSGSPDLNEPVSRNVALFGPGDVIGIDARAVFRTEPLHWTTNFEANYLAAIDFYDEDFPCRYTPAPPDAKNRLQPWLALVVLEERDKAPEFAEGKDVRDKPLPYIEVSDRSLFPAADQLWAWTHVHVNRSLAANDGEFVSTDIPAVIARFQAVLAENPDLAYSRVLCPRRLDPNKAYHAFLIPSFESGRRAGLGLDPFANPALPDVTTSAWVDYANRPEPTRYPVYYRWYFHTGGAGDFESLVRLLQPKPPDHRVGRRDMDVQKPGLNVRGIQAGRPDLGGVLKLGGALRVPDADFSGPELDEVHKYENWATPYPQPIQEDIAKVVDLADDYAALAADAANKGAGILDPGDPSKGDPDPVITPPLYGTWHAMTKRMLKARDGSAVPNPENWVHELNLDPRFRVGAGFGTRVVQDQQEKYMNAAWEQIGRVLEGNRRIRLGQLAMSASTAWYDRHLRPLATANQQRALLVVAPLNKRVVFDGATVHQQYAEAFVQPAMTSPALRRVLRPRARLVKSLPFSNNQPFERLLDRVNKGEVSAAPPKVAPPGAMKIDDFAKAVGSPLPPGLQGSLGNAAIGNPALRWWVLLIALLLAILIFFIAPFAVAAAVAAALFGIAWWVFNIMTKAINAAHAAQTISTVAPPASTIDAIPPSPDFVLTDPGSGYVPTRGTTDSFEATRFKDGLRALSTLLGASTQAGQVPPKRTLDLGKVSSEVVVRIDPQKTIPKRVMSSVIFPQRVLDEIGGDFVEAMAYPVIDTPMYEPLKNLSPELLLPNITFIPQNSVTLLETNQKFIEAYMAGLNHEFARELLWREYPTDQRGSYFRQFWDVSAFFNAGNLDDATLKEKLRDITRLDFWALTSKLGEHNNRQMSSGGAATVVLVIRGELLKRYPNAVVYAHRARWQLTKGKIDPTLERLLEDLTPAEELKPPLTKVRTPLYDAKVDPDIYFFGFDLTVAEARGGSGDPGDDDPGWFFVIKERPGEPRFGLEPPRSTRGVVQPAKLGSWNDLSWTDVEASGTGPFLQIPGAKTPAISEPIVSDPEHVQFLDDKNVAWSGDMSSADLAYILFRVPVLVAIHATELIAN
ncbi:MAG TPA: hypothetical protein VEZ11_00380 [Thermoanaerobaculia bacterium]|nr:hypothetical protein [Thermoanaerobaculia bacterium]